MLNRTAPSCATLSDFGTTMLLPHAASAASAKRARTNVHVGRDTGGHLTQATSARSGRNARGGGESEIAPAAAGRSSSSGEHGPSFIGGDYRRRGPKAFPPQRSMRFEKRMTVPSGLGS